MDYSISQFGLSIHINKQVKNKLLHWDQNSTYAYNIHSLIYWSKSTVGVAANQ